MQRGKWASRQMSILSAALLAGLGLLPTSANADQPRPTFVALAGAVTPGQTTELVPVGGTQNQPFIVPSGKILVLTDIILSPQSFPPSGDYSWGVTPSPGFLTTALFVTSTAADASSFQVHLTTGMAFQAGSKVRVGLTFGSSDVNISAFGFLEKAVGPD